MSSVQLCGSILKVIQEERNTKENQLHNMALTSFLENYFKETSVHGFRQANHQHLSYLIL